LNKTKNDIEFFVSGYPRSGNTFFNFVVRELYGSNRPYLVRSHDELNILNNLEKNVCVVIRNPLQSIASYNQFRTQLTIRQNPNVTFTVTLDDDFNRYLRYYNFIDKHLDQVSLMNFAKFSKDSDYITNKINTKFNIKPLVHLDVEVLKQKMTEKGGVNHLPRKPNDTRQQIEKEVLGHPLYKEVLDLHDHLISKGDTDEY